MAFLDDFQNAVSGYPTASVAITIVDTAAVPPSTVGAVNINEVWSFQVRVRNNGALNMTGVSLRIQGQNGATVGTSAAGPFSPAITFGGTISLNGHGGQQDTVNLFFKAPNAIKPAGTQLVTAQIAGFDANLNHLLIDHSLSSATPTGAFNSQVFP